MVQFIRGADSKKDASIGMLSQALGGGLGNFMGDFFASRSLDSVLQDKSLRNKPLSERWAAIDAALRPHGQRGQRLLMQQLAREQQVDQEQQQQRQAQSQESLANAWEKFQRGEPITKEDLKDQDQKTQLDFIKATQPKNPPKSEFNKILERKSAEDYVKAREELPKIQDALKNIQRQRELSSQLRGVSGTLSGFLGTKKASEFNELGMLNLEPVLKIFNPSGPIAQRKLEFLKDKYVPKATDLQTTIDGKLNGIERLLKQAQARNQAKIDIYHQYEGNPPLDEIKNFDEESKRILDAFTEEKESSQSFEDLPPASQYEGRIMTNQKTGQKMLSNGQSWEPLQ